MSEKEFMIASSESWREEELSPSLSSRIIEMNSWRPFYLMLRNYMKKLLGENFIEERNKKIKDDPVEYVKFLIEDAGIKAFIIDEGFGKKEQEIPVKYRLLFRIESIINDNLFSLPFNKAVEFFEETLRNKIRKENYAGFKSIIAYRTGLKIICNKDLARNDFLDEEIEWFGRKAKGFRDYLFCKTMEIAKELNVPFQVHTGAGDRDIKLELSRPSYLTELVRKYEGKIVLVHAGFPYHRESAWMSYLFPSVYLDVSQVFPFATTAGKDVLREVLQIAPINKVMYGSDAFELPEIAWISAKMFRKYVISIARKMKNEEIIDNEEEVIKMISEENAFKLYGLQ
nr:amidohydrolase family protein [Acidianus sp. HS-5]